MPSIFHQSPGMAARGLSLIDQSIARQPNGLVNVVVKYAAPAANLDQVLPQFTIDSAPPIYPDIIDRRELQTERLYLQNFTAEKSAGIATINAQYCGALLRGLQTPYQTNQFEQGTILVEAFSFLGPLIANPIGVGLIRQGVVDSYLFQYRARVAYYEVAVVGEQSLGIEPPKIIDAPGQDGLIVGWNLVRATLPTPPPNTPFFYPAFYRRDWEPKQWLELIVLQYAGRPDFSIVTTTDVNNITPTVRTYKLRAKLSAQNFVAVS
jgi:hypothetical protein